MKSLLIALVLYTAAVSSVFGQNTGAGQPADSKTGSKAGPEVGPEAVAKKVLEAVKAGDVDAWIDCYDLKAVHEGGASVYVSDADVNVSFEQWLKKFRKMMMRNAAGWTERDAEYEILDTAEEDGTAYVRIKSRVDKGSAWKEFELPFRKVDGEWKCILLGAKPSKREQGEKAWAERPVSQEVRCDKCGATSPLEVAFKDAQRFQTCPKCGEKAARAIVYWVCGNIECNSQLIKVAGRIVQDPTAPMSPNTVACPKCGKPDFIDPIALHLEDVKEIAEKTGQDFP